MKKVFNYLFLFILSSLFISCENFLNGQKLVEEINSRIQYENYKPVRVNIAADANTGTVFPVGEKDLKPTDTLEISFEAAKNYIFKYWEVLDFDTKKKCENIIKIYNPDKIKTSLEVLSETSSTLWLRPVCIEKLKVDFSPAQTATGVPKNTSLVVTFNHPVKQDSFKYFIEDSVEANDLSAHYLKPDFSDEGKTVIIRANPANLPFTNDSGQRNIKFTLSPDTGFEDELVTFDKEYSWTYKINNERDFDPPVIRSLVANKIGRYGEVVPEPLEYRPYNGNVDDFDNSDGNNNYVMNKLKFTFSAYDEVSGIGKILVQEKLLYTNENVKTPAYQKVIEKEYYVNELPMDGSIQNYEFIHDFTKTENDDGVVEVSFIPVDYCGNRETDESKIPSFIVVRDAKFLESRFKITNFIEFDINKIIKTSVNKINEDIKNIRITGSDLHFGTNDNKIELEDLSIKIFTGTNVNSLQEKSFNYENGANQINFYYDDLSQTQDNYLKITGLDMAGNELSILRMIPKSITPINGYKNNDDSYSVFYGEIKTDMPGYLGYRKLVFNPDVNLDTFTNETEEIRVPRPYKDEFSNDSEQTYTDNIILTYPGYFVDDNYKNALYGFVSVYKISDQQTGNDIAAPEVVASVVCNPEDVQHATVKISFSNTLENGMHFYVKHSSRQTLKSPNISEVDKNEITIARFSGNNNYYLQVVVFASDGKSVKSEIKEVEIPGYGDIDVEYPSFEYDYFVFKELEGGIEIQLQDESGFKEENGKAVLEYWFVPDTTGSANFDYSTLISKYGNGRKVYFDNKKNEEIDVLLPIVGMGEGIFRIYLSVEDSLGNKFSGNVGNSNVLYEFFPSDNHIEYEYKDKKLSATPKGYDKLVINKYDAVTCKFIQCDENAPSEELDENYFYAVNCRYYLDYGYSFTLPYYFYSGTGSKVTCNKKNLAQINSTAYTVSSDQPYLVQVLYNATNYGNDQNIWELYSAKTGLEQFSGYQIYAVDTSDLCDGDYYVVKAYYADGTTKNE